MAGRWGKGFLGGRSMQTAAWPALRHRLALLAPFLVISTMACGCGTTLKQYLDNGFKVGPNYCRPRAAVAKQWIDADDKRIRSKSDDLSRWWRVFNDPALDGLIDCAYHQNLTLREAGYRVLQARAQLMVAEGGLFPQTQQATGNYIRSGLSEQTANNPLRFGIPNIKRFYNRWDFGFNLAWELDFWGRFRRAIESNCAALDASVADYDDALVTLLGDVATNYALLRTYQERLRYAKENVALQRETLDIVEAGYRAGTVNKVDLLQARSTLEQTQAEVPELLIGLRQTGNQLCILLGIPPVDLQKKLGTGAIPTAPVEVAAGIPAELLCRRPDVRRAERLAAAQSAQIGVAVADFYPHFSITGTLNYSAEDFKDLFHASAMNGAIGPAFQWDVLNYGRTAGNVNYQEARFRELVATYQNTVLSAAQDVENGLVSFLRGQQRVKAQTAAVKDSKEAVTTAVAQYQAGTILFTQVTQLEQTLVTQQDTLAQAQNETVAGLIRVYRALGGGWQIRLTSCAADGSQAESTSSPDLEVVPTPPAEPRPAGEKKASRNEKTASTREKKPEGNPAAPL